MQKRTSTTKQAHVRSLSKSRLLFVRYRRIILPVLLLAIMVSALVTGYQLGKEDPVVAVAVDDQSGLNAWSSTLAADEQLCETVEKINLETALSAEKARADDLADSLVTQENEMNQLEETILNSLMANFSSQLLSRSSATPSDYADEAKNLISLQNKLENFKQTPEAAEIDLTEYEAAINSKLAYLPTLKPIPGALEGYGTRIHPIYGYRQFHPAVDIGAAKGTPIKAAGSGTVTEARYSSGSGNYIKISHGNGFTTVYMHCSELDVSAGQKVAKGDVIGLVGSTGTSTTPHLHFEIRLYGEPLNPAIMIMG